MKFKIVILLLVISVIINIFILGKTLLVDKWYEPSENESIILSEMVKKTVENDDYKRISDKENVIAIDTSMDKNKGGAFPYYFEVFVRTDRQTYLFYCEDDVCSRMELGGTTYSIYKDENHRLPLKR